MLSSKIAPWLGVLGLGAGGGILLQGNNPGEGTEVQLSPEVPSRQQQLQRLAASKPYRQQQNPFDVLIIGGGATGAGIAVDAATRWVGGGRVSWNNSSAMTKQPYQAAGAIAATTPPSKLGQRFSGCRM